MNETHFKRFVMILRSAGFVDSSMIRSQNAVNFAYILYLTLRNQDENPAVIESLVESGLSSPFLPVGIPALQRPSLILTFAASMSWVQQHTLIM